MDIKKIKEQIDLLKKEIESYTFSEENKHLFKRKILGKEGAINMLFQDLYKGTPAEKKELGTKLNTLKKIAEAKYRSQSITQATEPIVEHEDITLPAPPPQLGSIHPLALVEEKVIDILEKIGFQVQEGPEIEDEWHNFTALNIPPNHPARDMQDTFFVKRKKKQAPMALRTHTSSVQIRVMEQAKPPIRIISVGRVFRNETISARSHCTFHQIEGLYIDKDVSFTDLKEVLYHLAHHLFGKDTAVRLRPSYFPFTEPSAEVDIACLLCKGNGCQVCKKSGWVEIGGAGMVDPKVLKNCKISPKTYTGYAFGFGIERLAMLLAQIPDVRLFTQNDLRFLRQFSQGVL